MNYKQYLNSKIWKQRRQAKLQQAKYRCENCGERDNLEVHHKYYTRLGNEKSSDLIVLCKSCHWIADQLRKDSSFSLPDELPNGWENITPYDDKKDHKLTNKVWPIDRRKP